MEALFLGHNKISDILPLKNLTNLTVLSLPNNMISDISPLFRIDKLIEVDLSSNSIQSVPYNFVTHQMDIRFDADDYGVNLKNNPLKHPPIEIVQQGKDAIKAYFEQFDKLSKAGDVKALKTFEEQISKKTADKLNQVKTILIGDGGAGKTSLLKQFFGEAFDKKESQTHGINIRQKDFEIQKEKIGVNFWDFGGQEIMHATHQFFLSRRAFYVTNVLRK